MYTHILIATDGSELAGMGLDHGLSLARRLAAKVTILNVTETFPGYAVADLSGIPGASSEALEDYRKRGRDAAARILGEAKQRAERMGLPVETIHLENARPAEAIVETAKACDCNLIVMASHGRRRLGRLFLGSETIETLTHSPVPVLVVR